MRYNGSVENVAITSIFVWRDHEGEASTRANAVTYDQHFVVSLDCGVRVKLALGVLSCAWTLLSPCCSSLLKSNYSYHGAAVKRLRLMYCQACMRRVPYLQKEETRALANDEVQAWLEAALAHHADPFAPPILAWDLQELATQLHREWTVLFWERPEGKRVFRQSDTLHHTLAEKYSGPLA